jgi:hypothetical protein
LLQALALRCEGPATVGRHEAINDGHWGADLLVAAISQSVGHVRAGGLFHWQGGFVLVATSGADVTASPGKANPALLHPGEKMGTVAASIQAKVIGWALNGAAGDRGLSTSIQRPGVGYLCAAERAVKTVGTT